MTAPLPSTSFGSQQRNCGERELQAFSSPLKRTHSQGQKDSGGDEAANQQSGQDGAAIRPVKKLKQVAVIDEEEGEGLVARLFKYAWHFVGGAPEGMCHSLGVEVIRELTFLSSQNGIRHPQRQYNRINCRYYARC